MEIQKKYHISIGSNIGNRIKNIQETIDLIHSRIASLLSISSIYETESIGFEGDDFFNICASFNSFKSPHFIMNEFLEIEKLLGRVRSKEKKYTSRIIDIDILLVDDMIINSEELTIPHKEMCNRRFVLDPLIEIDPNIIHPVNKMSKFSHQYQRQISLEELIYSCELKNDENESKFFWETVEYEYPIKKYLIDNPVKVQTQTKPQTKPQTKEIMFSKIKYEINLNNCKVIMCSTLPTYDIEIVY